MRKKSRRWKRIMSGALVLCAVISLCGCTTYSNFKAAFFPGDAVEQERTIKIGVYEAQSGKNSEQGKAEVRGIELAHELYGTVLGKTVELVYGDNQSNIYVGDTVIQEVVSQSPSVILGSCGETLTLVASDYVKAASIPAITVSSTNPLITANNDYYFTATFSETRQGDALADFAYTGEGKDAVATVRMENDDTAVATIKRFTNRIKKLSGTADSVVGSYVLTADATDYTDVIEAIRASGAKAVFLAVPPATAQSFLEKVVELRMTHVMFLGGRSWNDKKYLDFIAGQEKLDIAYPSDFSQRVTTSMSAKFLQAYQQKYGADAEPAEATAIAFDAYLLALQAIKDAYEKEMATTEEDLQKQYTTDALLKGAREELAQVKETGIPTGRQIRAALATIEHFEGASGMISYNGKNEASKSITINHIAGGKELPDYQVE